MAIKIVVTMFLMCLVLGEISYMEARITHKESAPVPNSPKGNPVFPITEIFNRCFHDCIKHCPRDDERKYFDCELRCDTHCSHKSYRSGKRDESVKERGQKGGKVEAPETVVTRVYNMCYEECLPECASDDAKCLKLCKKICTKVAEHEGRSYANRQT